MGRFSDAAKLDEKNNLNNKSDYPVYLKIALLYELDQDFENRDRVLKKVIRKFKRDKDISKEMEGLIYLTLSESSLINESSLSLPWSLNRKISLANRFDTLNSSKKAKKIILSQKTSTGAQWSKHVLNKIQKEYKKPSKINFYGRSSRWKFKKRVKAMERFNKIAKSYLEGADSQTRVYILQMLKVTYEMMAIEIQSTPLPQELDEETLGKVMNQLADMATPYQKVALDYTDLQNKELEALSNKEDIIKNLESGSEDYTEFIKTEEFDELKDTKNIIIKIVEITIFISHILNFYWFIF